MKLREDNSINRMDDSLDLFEETINSDWFYNTDIILFLNKKDIFEEKIKKTSLKLCFPNYEGSDDYEEATGYIREQFLARNNNPSRNIFIHLTCATSTDNMEIVFQAIQSMILNYSLDHSGLITDRR